MGFTDVKNLEQLSYLNSQLSKRPFVHILTNIHIGYAIVLSVALPH